MGTAQIVPVSRLLGPSDRIISGTSHATPESFFLVSNQADPGWDILLKQWDLAVRLNASGVPIDSAHIVEVRWKNKVRLDKNIFTAGSLPFMILRGADFRLIFPGGNDYSFSSIQAFEPQGNDIVGVEVFGFNLQNKRRQFLHRMDSTGVLHLAGRDMQANWIESLIVTNYIETNVMVRFEGMNVSIPPELFEARA